MGEGRGDRDDQGDIEPRFRGVHQNGVLFRKTHLPKIRGCGWRSKVTKDSW